MSSRNRAHVAVAELERQDNRTHYLVYALEGTERHDSFLNRLFRLLPRAATRGKIRDAIESAGGGRYRLWYNRIVVSDTASAARRLF